MARVKMIPPETTEPETRKVYDGVLKQWGRISNFSQVLAHQPAALAGWMLPNEAIRLTNVKADPDYVKIQQLVIIKTSALNGSAYCMSHNVPLGKKIGLTEAQIAAAQGDDYMASPDLDDKQKAAVRWAEAVTKMTARDDDEAFAEMKRHFSEKQIVELTVFCGMWNYSNRLCEALHVDLERPDKRIEFQRIATAAASAAVPREPGERPRQPLTCLARRHIAEHDAALGLVGLGRLDQRDDDGIGRDLVVLHHGVGDVLAKRRFLFGGAVADGVDDDLGHGCSSC